YTLGTHWADTDKDNQVDSGELVAAVKGRESTIYKLMTYAVERWKQEQRGGASPTTQLLHFEEAYIAGLENDGYKYGGVVPLVCLYKIKYTE
ncbi:MAG: hypothetical protein QXQ41_07335, partial [Candidatus Bathyarchaeia archaeon]